MRELDLAFARIVSNKEDAFFDAEALKEELSAGVALKEVTLLPLQDAVDAGEEMFGGAVEGDGGGGDGGVAAISRKPAELAVGLAALKAAKRNNAEWRLTVAKKDEADKTMITIVQAKLQEAMKARGGENQVEQIYLKVNGE